MRLVGLVLIALLSALPTKAQDKAGAFDYYLLALSWSPGWCALTGDARDDPQCDAGRGLTFTVHGLWPQYETGYPKDCFATKADPSRADTEAMTDIMGGAGLAFYQWRKHGRCSGLSARAYFATLRRAHASITIPPIFARVDRDLILSATVIEAAFLAANPALSADQVTITCKSRKIQEVRLCLTRDLHPRSCAADVARDCSLPDAELDAVR